MGGKEEGIGWHERYGLYNDIEIIQICCLWMGMWKSGIGGWIGEIISPLGGGGTWTGYGAEIGGWIGEVIGPFGGGGRG